MTPYILEPEEEEPMAIIPNSAVTEVVPSPNYSTGRPAGSPNVIVIHHWGKRGQTHNGVVSWLTRADGDSSAHYVVSEGRVTQLVSDLDRAWHAGRDGNPRGVGIECRPERSEGDFETVARLIAAIRSEHGNLPLRGHRDYMPTECPGDWYAVLWQLDRRALEIAAGGRASQIVTPAESWRLAVDGDWDARTGTRFREVMGVSTDAPWAVALQRAQYAMSWQMDAYKIEAAERAAGLPVTGRMRVDGTDEKQFWAVWQAWYNQSGIPEGAKITVNGVDGKETYSAVQIALNHSWARSKGFAVRP